MLLDHWINRWEGQEKEIKTLDNEKKKLQKQEIWKQLEGGRTELTTTQTQLDAEKSYSKLLKSNLETVKKNLLAEQKRSISIKQSLSDTTDTMIEENKKLNQDLADLSKTKQQSQQNVNEKTTKTTLIVSLSVVAGLIGIPIISYFAWKRFK